ncbi:MAG TPA: undecaprenyl-phosphate glucose phosphotransferase [Polyangiaceae bacterium]|nr:undecaprenyl-phosphate glucose phosphotransferase [Polyangiaceae bacterium]
MSNKPERGLLRNYESTAALVQRLVDAGWIVAALYFACWLRPQPWEQVHTVAALVAVLAFHLTAETNGLYRSWRGAPLKHEVFQAVTTWAIAAPVLLFVAFITQTSASYSRFVVTMWFGLAPLFLILWRITLRLGLMELRRHGRNSRTVAIAGLTPMAERIAERIATDPYSGMRILGFYDDRKPGRGHVLPKDYGEFIGDLDQLVTDAREGRIDRVYITLPLKAEPRINTIVHKLADTTATVFVVADFLVFDLLHAQWSAVGDIPVVSIFDTPFHGLGGWLKRLEDIVIGSLILLIIAVPLAAIAIGVKLSSPGPVFFKQRRYGLNGKEIRVLKFRSMTVCEDGPVVTQAKKNDQRVTRFGAFLRQTSLDELPQFIQVLTGEMSIVGPRPHAVAHNELYRGKIHGYMLRHKVKPGITGWAQVNGWRGETDTVDKMEKRVEHDLEYIHNWGLLWDLKIIFLTVFGRKTNENAY